MPNATQLLSFFNLFAGMLLIVSMIFFFGGFIIYIIRLGTWPSPRDVAVGYMKWGVATLFSLVVILGFQQFLLKNILIAYVIAALLIIWFLIWAYSGDSSSSDKEKSGGAP